ncbi:IspD/TarI family cytidylyltransferase [Nocardioides mesophilus]|uniref:2-C-methyl-D-erythritol 4-phosphate cytidylyltransferase n=1 Tax=Nocardioides mesophilus TaxID=433659 RepID=A0A7G9REL2_9ACTN|nr:2-C-methyl-D-erythritol 4-phosphate cytidylyltransferase [Nocardioides mesophilus]QNN54037.1 2-C-methyl-D-erythritol 4-phosphate cytidylyltransferase [Nocardioides mesophilus]
MSVDDAPFADAIILAAGSSTRMRGPDKLLLEFGGLPLIAWTLRAAARASNVRNIIVVAHADRASALRDEPWIREVEATVVVGGGRRQDSVASGVEASQAEVVLIHDGARPLVNPELFDSVALAARAHGAAVPVVAVPESMRRLVDGKIVEIVDKTGLFRSQTPHGARRELLLEAYAHLDPRGPETFIDETSLVQSAGFVVSTVVGDPTNLKLTLPGDEKLAFAILEGRARADEVPPSVSV